MSKITYNIPLILSSPEDADRLLATLEAERTAFNEASKIQFKQKINSIVILHKKFYKKFRKKNPKIPAQVVIRAENACLSAYKTIKSNKHKIKEPIVKNKLALRLDRNLYTWKNEKFRFTAIGGRRITCGIKKYSKVAELIEKYKFCDPLIFHRNNTFFISLTFNIPDIPTSVPELALGVDMGIKRVIATSEGIIYKDKKFNAEKRGLRFLKSKLQSKSATSKAALRHLKKLKQKEQNKNKNFSHHVANALLKTQSNVIVFEDLTGIKRNPKNKYKHSFNNKFSQIPIAQIVEITTYKALPLGKRVTTVNPWFTSQRDSRTGEKDGKRQGCRYYGKDGIVLDADCNAAVNIAIKSKLPVSLGNVLDGQVVVNQPYAGFSGKPPILIGGN